MVTVKHQNKKNTCQNLVSPDLISKYGGAVPRYTSYPTAPEWKHDYKQEAFEAAITKSNKRGGDYSLYLHIPFCESQCYYCGCNVVISKEHGIEDSYLQHIKEELAWLGKQIDPKRRVVQMAWGGGTPTFLTPEQIEDLYLHIEKHFNLFDFQEAEQIKNKHEYSIEIDPRVTSVDHLKVLKKLGFNRLSMGIQDFNLQTQETINRIQSYEMVESLVAESRKIGFESINFDLIYGLPHQNLETFKDTVAKVKAIDPERIALFNYAHIPSMFPFQKKYIADEILPSQEAKLEIFDMAVEEFTNFGYEFIGIDHFAKPDDDLAVAQKGKTLYRNFQGFTTHSGCDLFGAGVSAISDVAGTYKQNHKKINQYYYDLDTEQNFAAEKFFVSSEEDIERREIIKQLMCNYEVILDSSKYAAEVDMMKAFEEDKLLAIKHYDSSNPVLGAANLKVVKLEVTELGKFFVRNIASKFDTYIAKKEGHKVFSKAL